MGMIRTRGALWFYAGLLCFGVTIGAVSGSSASAGISQTLLSGLLSFVAGSLVGLAARGKEHGASVLGIPEVGQSLIALSLGICAGMTGGIQWRARTDRRQ